MMKSVKKLISIIFVLLICLNTYTTNVKAANTFEINGESVAYYYYSSSPNQCWRYANNIFYTIWGSNMDEHPSLLEGLSIEERSTTIEHLKKFVGYAPLGSSLRLTSYEGMYDAYDMVGHSQIIVQKDENGFTVLEGGMSMAPHCREHYYTWEEYVNLWCDYEYQYIKYINAPTVFPIASMDKDIEAKVTRNLTEPVEVETEHEQISRTMKAPRVFEVDETYREHREINDMQIRLQRYGFSMVLLISPLYYYINKKCRK